MRSVFIHYPKSSESVVRDWLNQNTAQVEDNRWLVKKIEAAVLYCSLSDDYRDWGPVELAALRSILAGPFSCVEVDVSGSIPGDMEVRALTLGIMDAVPGSVAEDDYTPHPWTSLELREGALIEGHPFFDYRGWAASEKG